MTCNRGVDHLPALVASIEAFAITGGISVQTDSELHFSLANSHIPLRRLIPPPPLNFKIFNKKGLQRSNNNSPFLGGIVVKTIENHHILYPNILDTTKSTLFNF